MKVIKYVLIGILLIGITGCSIRSERWTEFREIGGKTVEVEHIETTGIGSTKFSNNAEQSSNPWVEIPKIPIKYEAD